MFRQEVKVIVFHHFYIIPKNKLKFSYSPIPIRNNQKVSKQSLPFSSKTNIFPVNNINNNGSNRIVILPKLTIEHPHLICRALAHHNSHERHGAIHCRQNQNQEKARGQLRRLQNMSGEWAGLEQDDRPLQVHWVHLVRTLTLYDRVDQEATGDVAQKKTDLLGLLDIV